MRNVLRGIVVKSWRVNNIEVSTDHKHNKAIVRESVRFYNEFWIDRSNVMHNDQDQKKMISQ